MSIRLVSVTCASASACALVAVLAITPVAASSQSRQSQAQESPARWLPRVNYVPSGTEAWVRITREDRAAVQRNLSAAEEVIRQAVAKGGIGGFEALPTHKWSGLGSVVDPRGLLSYSLSIPVFVPTRAIKGETSDWITVTFNPYPDDLSLYLFQPPSQKEWDIRREFRRLAPTHGHTTYVPHDINKGIAQVLLTAGGRSPWARQVSREEYLVWLIRRNEETGYGAAHRKVHEKTPYELWMAEAPARKKLREDTLATIAATSPTQVATFREESEKMEREITEQLRASEAKDRAQAAIDRSAPTLPETLREKLAAMTPAQRTAPAWMKWSDLDEFVDEPDPSTIRPAHNFPDAWRDMDPSRIVLPDAEFFRKGRGLASDVRAITVAFSGAGKGRAIVTRIYEKIDWDALAALLEMPPR